MYSATVKVLIGTVAVSIIGAGSFFAVTKAGNQAAVVSSPTHINSKKLADNSAEQEKQVSTSAESPARPSAGTASATPPSTKPAAATPSSSVSKPTPAPSTSPTKAKPTAAAPITNSTPTRVDTKITNITVNLSPQTCYMGNHVYGYSYQVNLNDQNSGGQITLHWEYELTSSIQPSESQPQIPGSPMTGYSFAPGSLSVSDTEPYYRGINTFSLSSFRARLHATSPSDAYSNWVNIERYGGVCS